MLNENEKPLVKFLNLRKQSVLHDLLQLKQLKELTLTSVKVLHHFSDPADLGVLGKRDLELVRRNGTASEFSKHRRNKHVSIKKDKAFEWERSNSCSIIVRLDNISNREIVRSEAFDRNMQPAPQIRARSEEHKDTPTKTGAASRKDEFLQSVCVQRFHMLLKEERKAYRKFRRECLSLMSAPSLSGLETFLKYFHAALFGVERVFMFLMDDLNCWNALADLREEKFSMANQMYQELDSLEATLTDDACKLLEEGFLKAGLTPLCDGEGHKLFCIKLPLKSQTPVLIVCYAKNQALFLENCVETDSGKLKKVFKTFLRWYTKLPFQLANSTIRLDKIISRSIRTYERILSGALHSFEAKWKKQLENLLRGKLMRMEEGEQCFDIATSQEIFLTGNFSDSHFLNNGLVSPSTLQFCLSEAVRIYEEFDGFLQRELEFCETFRERLFNYKTVSFELDGRGIIRMIYRPFTKKFNEINEEDLEKLDEAVEEKMISSNKKIAGRANNTKKKPSTVSGPSPEIFVSRPEDQDINSMNFNILAAQLILEKHRYVWKIMAAINAFDSYCISLETFGNFLDNLQRKYNKRGNPFHNYDHGINVMHGCFYLTKHTRASAFLTAREIFSLVFSGLCHDADHTGHNNSFEINSFSKLANRYHDRSVLEQHHIATTFKLLSSDSSNIFENVRVEEVKEIRKIMISNILYTDMKEHFTLCGKFEAISQTKEDKDLGALFESEQNKLVLLGLLIHASDFSGSVKPFSVSSDWSKRVNQEFLNQDEIEWEIPPTPYMKDLDRPDIMAKAETGFLKVIVLPLWTQLNAIVKGDVRGCIDVLMKNQLEWARLAQDNNSEAKPKDSPTEASETAI